MSQYSIFIDNQAKNAESGSKLAYYDSKKGSRVLLLLNGLTSTPYSFEQLITLFDNEYRIIQIDLNLFESDSKNIVENFCNIFPQFLKSLQVKNLSIIAHSSGGSFLLTSLQKIRKICKIEKLIFLNFLPNFSEKSPFISQLASYDDNNPLVRFASADVCAYILLKEYFYDEKMVNSDYVKNYSSFLQQPDSKKNLINHAKAISEFNGKKLLKIAENITCPTLIIRGKNDTISDNDSIKKLHKAIKNSELKTINNCGHLTQEEATKKCANLIHSFLAEHHDKKVESFIDTTDNQTEVNSQLPTKTPLRLRNLVEKWSFGSLILFIFLKFIQLLKKMGLKGSDNGWRKATGIFLQKEESKFILGSFNLKYYHDENNIPTNLSDAKTLFISRISGFLQKKSGLHWAIEPSFFYLKRKKLNFTDIIETTFNEDGDLIKLTPYFDTVRGNFDNLQDKDMKAFFTHFIDYYNKLKNKKVTNIARRMTAHFHRWYLRRRALSFNAKLDLRQLIDRVLTATFITFELTPDRNSPKYMRRKFATPNVKRYRHPGWGLLNMIVRFTPDLKNSDLWVQYHHVPVDGMPMQELLEELKKNWGSTEELIYPNLSNHDSSPEIYYSGGKIFRARMFVDFSKFLQFRNYLNQNYSKEMNGPATAASMIIWGVAKHEMFKKAKVLFPVDIAEGVQFADERELSLLLIRPAKYFNSKNELEGFLQYQREFNKRLFATRHGSSDSYEMLDLYSLVHPIFYYLARDFFKESVSDYLGNMGLSMMKNAEMFISPLSDLQKNGFIALGNMNVPTADGGRAGAVSICGSRREIKAYIDAISNLAENFDKFFNININDKGAKND